MKKEITAFITALVLLLSMSLTVAAQSEDLLIMPAKPLRLSYGAEKSDTDVDANARFETKARYEIQDSQVAFYFELINLSGVPQTLTFNTGQQFEITVTDENGKEVYRYSDGKVFTEVIWEKTINAGESLKWQDVWDMTDKEGNRAEPGKYKAVITIPANPGEEGEKPDLSQLTTTVEFSL